MTDYEAAIAAFLTPALAPHVGASDDWSVEAANINLNAVRGPLFHLAYPPSDRRDFFPGMSSTFHTSDNISVDPSLLEFPGFDRRHSLGVSQNGISQSTLPDSPRLMEAREQNSSTTHDAQRFLSGVSGSSGLAQGILPESRGASYSMYSQLASSFGPTRTETSRASHSAEGQKVKVDKHGRLLGKNGRPAFKPLDEAAFNALSKPERTAEINRRSAWRSRENAKRKREELTKGLREATQLNKSLERKLAALRQDCLCLCIREYGQKGGPERFEQALKKLGLSTE